MKTARSQAKSDLAKEIKSKTSLAIQIEKKNKENQSEMALHYRKRWI